jgi:hypothetical protein
MVRWFRLIHFDGKAALNVFEGEDRKAARETHDKAFHLRQRVKANWSTLLQDQHRMRLANMLSGPLSLHELLSQRHRRTSHSAHQGSAGGYSAPPATRHTCCAQNKEPETRKPRRPRAVTPLPLRVLAQPLSLRSGDVQTDPLPPKPRTNSFKPVLNGG